MHSHIFREFLRNVNKSPGDFFPTRINMHAKLRACCVPSCPSPSLRLCAESGKGRECWKSAVKVLDMWRTDREGRQGTRTGARARARARMSTGCLVNIDEIPEGRNRRRRATSLSNQLIKRHRYPDLSAKIKPFNHSQKLSPSISNLQI